MKKIILIVSYCMWCFVSYAQESKEIEAFNKLGIKEGITNVSTMATATKAKLKWVDFSFEKIKPLVKDGKKWNEFLIDLLTYYNQNPNDARQQRLTLIGSIEKLAFKELSDSTNMLEFYDLKTGFKFIQVFPKVTDKSKWDAFINALKIIYDKTHPDDVKTKKTELEAFLKTNPLNKHGNETTSLSKNEQKLLKALGIDNKDNECYKDVFKYDIIINRLSDFDFDSNNEVSNAMAELKKDYKKDDYKLLEKLETFEMIYKMDKKIKNFVIYLLVGFIILIGVICGIFYSLIKKYMPKGETNLKVQQEGLIAVINQQINNLLPEKFEPIYQELNQMKERISRIIPPTTDSKPSLGGSNVNNTELSVSSNHNQNNNSNQIQLYAPQPKQLIFSKSLLREKKNEEVHHFIIRYENINSRKGSYSIIDTEENKERILTNPTILTDGGICTIAGSLGNKLEVVKTGRIIKNDNGDWAIDPTDKLAVRRYS
jgi:hypothetical protein